MALRDRAWEGYYPGHRDHLAEIFIPALSNSVRYDRITGAFASSVLALFCDGLRDFVENGGRARIMAGVELYEADVDAIERGEAGTILAERVDWAGLREASPEAVLEALAWLVANGILRVRVGAVVDDRGRVRSSEFGEWHQKVAIFTDDHGDSISFVGSPNESAKALSRNRESIDLNRNWVTNPEDDWDEARRVKEQKQEFENLWEDRDPSARVFPLPEAIERELLKYRPEQEPAWNQVIRLARAETGPTLPPPRPYQERAVNALLDNDNRLLIKHATGTGKTWTSFYALRELIRPGDVVVLLAPTTDLVEQWASPRNLGRFFPDAWIVKCTGEERWRRRLFNALASERDRPVIAVSTMHGSTMRSLFQLVRDKVPPERTILVGDEVHNLGAPTRAAALQGFDAGRARIGLSATPSRGDEGDQAIRGYFGNRVDEVTLWDAIHEYEVLSPYEYHFHTVVMTADERTEYNELSDQIVHLYHKYRDGEGEPLPQVADRHPDLLARVMERARVHKECEEKTTATASLVDEVGDRTLVFCNTVDHARRVKRAIDPLSSRNVGLFHSGLTGRQRERCLRHFGDGTLDVIVSIDCLTEGVDVPACDSAILVTNSTSEREAVQRRGRVLREAEGLDKAIIHDFLVIPESEERFMDGRAEPSGYELAMVHRELDRAERMNEAATNRAGNDERVIRLRMAARRYDRP